MKKIIFSITILSVLLSCQSNDSIRPEKPDDRQQTERKSIELTEREKTVIEKNNTFAFELLRTVWLDGNKDENILISPFSATLALAMLNNGAEGNTREQIHEVLGYGNLTREELNGYFMKMLTALQDMDPRVTLETGNSIWIEQTFPALDSFVKVNRTYYEAEVYNKDFYDPQTLQKINNWCSEKTHGKIPFLLDEINKDNIMYLINALYFKGVWTVPFDKANTKDEKFSNNDGSTPLLPTMNNELLINHSYHDKFALAELPYGNEAFSMVILLPHEDTSLASVIRELSVEQWKSAVNSLNGKTITLKVPRFKMEYKRDLINDLISMGMEDMCSVDADFTSIHPTAPLKVSQVLQKTYAGINEEGTEAAGVTSVSMSFTSTGNEKPEVRNNKFYVNRPFMYFIKENSTGTIFFTGVMNNLSVN